MKSYFYRWLPALIWAFVVFGLSSLPGNSIPDLGFRAQDKVVHCLVFGTLAVLVLRALRGTRYDRRPRVAIVLAVIIATAYGFSDEFHQSFVPNRSSDLFDVAADALGALLGALAFTFWSRRRLHLKKVLEIPEKNPEIAG